MSKPKLAATTSTAVLAIITLLLGIGLGYALGSQASAGGVETVTVTITGTGAIDVSELSGDIAIDGSSTVYPITEAVAEAFMDEYPNVRVTVGISGTGGGFKRFITGETDINDASRQIKPSEVERAQESGVEWIEIPIGIDGLSVVVNNDNDWVDCLTLEELKLIWEPKSSVQKWSDIRPGWPDVKIALYGPGPDSGTFDFFTEHVVGESGASRTDYVASEDDNVLVAGVEAEKYALAYFGYAYYITAKNRIRAVPIDAGNGCIEPTDENIRTFKYPLSRPLFIYVNKQKFEEKPELRRFVEFYLENAPQLVPMVGYTPFPDSYYRRALAFLKAGLYDDLLKLTRLE